MDTGKEFYEGIGQMEVPYEEEKEIYIYIYIYIYISQVDRKCPQ
jgi:hypothetical protein